MEFEDSRNALFAEPNAYIQNFNKKEKPKKIVFSEPYECAPNFYINNDFKKKECNCISKDRKDCHDNHDYNKNCGCENKKNHSDCNCSQQNNTGKNFLSGFNLQSMLPLLGMFNKGGSGGVDLANIMSMFGVKGENNMLTNLLGNKDMLSNITSLFSPKKEKLEIKKIQPTDIDIKNYTKVE